MAPERQPDQPASSGAAPENGLGGGSAPSAEGGLCEGGGRKTSGFSRHCRLRSTRAFAEAFEGDRQWPARTLVLWVRRAPDAACRVGVVASKRTFRQAVQRNRARRLLREAFRLNRSQIAGDVDLVLLARRKILDVKRPAVERDLLRVCHQAGILREEGPGCSDA